MWRTTLMLLLLTGCFYVMPVQSVFRDGTSGLRLVASLLALSGFALVLRIQVRAVRDKKSAWARIEALLTALYLLVVVFAVIYERIAVSTQGQFNGINNRTDALYFTVTTLATVGFGDITPTSTLTRTVTTALIVLGVALLGAGVRVLIGVASQVNEDRRRRATPPA